jgi:hypothetical protein
MDEEKDTMGCPHHLADAAVNAAPTASGEGNNGEAATAPARQRRTVMIRAAAGVLPILLNAGCGMPPAFPTVTTAAREGIRPWVSCFPITAGSSAADMASAVAVASWRCQQLLRLPARPRMYPFGPLIVPLVPKGPAS